VSAARDIECEARWILSGSGITARLAPMRHKGNLESGHAYDESHDSHTTVVRETQTGSQADHMTRYLTVRGCGVILVTNPMGHGSLG